MRETETVGMESEFSTSSLAPVFQAFPTTYVHVELTHSTAIFSHAQPKVPASLLLEDKSRCHVARHVNFKDTTTKTD
jgi:hypothetical protein